MVVLAEEQVNTTKMITSVVQLDYKSCSGDQMPFISGGGRAKLTLKAGA